MSFQLQNNLFGNMEMFTHLKLSYCVMKKCEYHVVVSILTQLFFDVHKKIKVPRQPILM